MTATSDAAAGSRPGGRRPFHGWLIVAALSVTQTVGYGVLYYPFAVLLRPIAVTMRVSTTTVTGAMTCSILAGAVMAVPVGRWLDRHGGRALMTTGSIVGTGLLVAWSQVQQVWQLYAVLIGIGVTGAMVLYEPAFAVIVSWFDSGRRPRALLAVTLVAGFASAIFLPLTGALVDRHGWRTALLVLAVVHGIVTVPLHALVLRTASHPPAGGPRTAVGDRATVVRAALADARFWAMAVAFVAHGAAMSAMTFHLVGLLIDAGHPATFAATVTGLLGVLSVTGRVVLTGAQRRIRATTVVAAIFTVQAAGALGLLAIGGSRPGAVIGVVAFGLGYGIASVATPTLLADRYGTVAFATIAGSIAVPITLARAGAPLAAAALVAAAGYPPVVVGISAACLVAAAGIVVRATAPSPVHGDQDTGHRRRVTLTVPSGLRWRTGPNTSTRSPGQDIDTVQIRPAELAAIRAGDIDLAFRRWDRPRLRVGTLMRTAVGLIEVTSVDRVPVSSLTAAEARRAGAPTLAALRAGLDRLHAERPVYRIGLRHAGDDPRQALRAAVPNAAEIDALLQWLDRLDRASSTGPWTRATLLLIDELPATRAPDLAQRLGRDTASFKQNVRKLKERGLTESLDIGYRLSARGAAVLDHEGHPRAGAHRAAPPPGIPLPHIGAPATRALTAHGVTSLEQVAGLSAAEVAAMHGVGPYAVTKLRDALSAAGLTFRDEPAAPTS